MLSESDARTAYRMGFTKAEVAEMEASREMINLSAPAWYAALQNRARYAMNLRRAWRAEYGVDLPRGRYERMLNARRPRNSPWEWLKLSYHPKKKIDFINVAKGRARLRTLRMRRLAR